MERKKEDETIIEIGKFWEEQSRKLFIQAGKEKAERLSIDMDIRAAKLQKDYQDRLKLDTNLTGWTSWWGRMEQEANASRRMARLGK